jgi:hypothetical protein
MSIHFATVANAVVKYNGLQTVPTVPASTVSSCCYGPRQTSVSSIVQVFYFLKDEMYGSLHGRSDHCNISTLYILNQDGPVFFFPWPKGQETPPGITLEI